MESGERAPLIRNLGSSSRVGIFTLGETYPGLHSIRWVAPINGLNASALALRCEFNHDPSDLQPVPESLYRKRYTAFSTYSAYYYTCTNTLKDMSTCVAEHVFVTYGHYLRYIVVHSYLQAKQHWQ